MSKLNALKLFLYLETLLAMKRAIVFVGVAFLAFPSIASGDGETVCTTESCKEKAKRILKLMDTDVKPCDDFYQFTCGKFLKNEKPKGKGSNSTFSDLQNIVNEQIRDVLEEPEHPGEHDAYKATKRFYAMCLKVAKSASTGKRAKRLLRTAGWPVLGSWREEEWTVHGHEHRLRSFALGGGGLVDVYLSPGPRDTGRAQITVDQPMLVRQLHRNLESVEELELPHVRSYEDYMVDLAVMFGADRRVAQTQLRDSLKFELELEQIIDVPRNRHRPYQLMTLAELQNRFGWIDWSALLAATVVSTSLEDDELIKVYQPEYFDMLLQLISEHPSRAIANFMGWRAAERLSLMLTPEMDKRRIQFDQAFGVTTKEPWKLCLGLVSYSGLDLAVNSMYVKKYMSKEKRELVGEMVSKLKDQMNEVIKSEDWIEDKTKEKALLKLCKMRQLIGYPNELTDKIKMDKYYGKLNLNGLTDFLEAKVLINKWMRKYGYSLKRKYQWTMHGAASVLVNAFYDPRANVLELPTAFVQMPLFSESIPRYLYYSTAGMVGGHEITHGFDNGGIYQDEEGDFKMWWDASSKMNYEQRSICMLHQYRKYVDQHNATATDDEPLYYRAGNHSLQEIIADHGGLKLSYLAYQKVSAQLEEPEPLLPDLEHFTREQMFFISLGSMWCWLQDPKELPRRPLDIHPPAQFRVNGVLQNFPQFSKAFNCEAGSNMNPKTKCSVW